MTAIIDWQGPSRRPSRARRGLEPKESEAIKRILVVDDDQDILQVVRYTLEPEGFEVTTATSAEEALAQIEKEGLPHLAIVDIMMPGTDGLQLVREIQKYADLPVIMLSAIDDEEKIVEVIEEVAEDYLTKPFNPKELAARAKRILRRLGDFSYRLDPVTKIDDHLAIDFAQKRVEVDGRTVSLTPTETKILHILLSASERTVTSDYILRRVWPLDEVFEDTLRVHIHRLRQKIEPDPAAPRYLITRRGSGYSFHARR